MALPVIATDTQRQATAIRESTAQAETRVQNEKVLSRIGETIGGLAPVITGTVAGVFSNVPFIGLATAFVSDKIKEARKEKAENKRRLRLEKRQRKEAADILVAEGKVSNKKEALAMIDEGILRNAQKAEKQRKENLLSNFDLSKEQKETTEQREENANTERDNLETRVENTQIERETLEGMGEGLALETTVTSIDNTVSAIGDLLLDRFAEEEKRQEKENRRERSQLAQQRERRIEESRVAEGEPEREDREESEDRSGMSLSRLLPMLLTGLAGLGTTIAGVSTAILGAPAAIAAGVTTAGAAVATATGAALTKLGLKKVPTPDVDVDKKDTKGKPKTDTDKPKGKPKVVADTDKPKTDTDKPKGKPKGTLGDTKETLGDKATKQTPKKGGIGDAIKKFKRVAKKVGFKRLALLIGKRIGTTVAAGLFTGPFAIIVGLIGIGLTVYEISNILDDIEKEFEEGKSVDETTQPKDISSAELAKMSPEEAKKAGLIDFADQDDLNDRIEELRMKEQTRGEPERQADFVNIEDRAKAERIVASLITREGGKQNYEIEQAPDGSFNIYRVDSTPSTGAKLTDVSREQSGKATQANIVDASTRSSSTTSVNNTSTTIQGAPLQPANVEIGNRYSSRYH